MGWAMRIFSTQFFSMVACIAISNPVNINVPKPKTEKGDEPVGFIAIMVVRVHTEYPFN